MKYPICVLNVIFSSNFQPLSSSGETLVHVEQPLDRPRPLRPCGGCAKPHQVELFFVVITRATQLNDHCDQQSEKPETLNLSCLSRSKNKAKNYVKFAKLRLELF